MIDKSLLASGRLGEMITMALGEEGNVPSPFAGPSKLPPSEQVRAVEPVTPVEPTTMAVGEEDGQMPVSEAPARPIATTMAVGEEDGIMENADVIRKLLPEGVFDRLFPTAPTNYPVQETAPIGPENPFFRAVPASIREQVAALPYNPFQRPPEEEEPAQRARPFFDPSNLQNMTPAELLIQSRNIFRRDT